MRERRIVSPHQAPHVPCLRVVACCHLGFAGADCRKNVVQSSPPRCGGGGERELTTSASGGRELPAPRRARFSLMNDAMRLQKPSQLETRCLMRLWVPSDWRSRRHSSSSPKGALQLQHALEPHSHRRSHVPWIAARDCRRGGWDAAEPIRYWYPKSASIPLIQRWDELIQGTLIFFPVSGM